MNYIKISSIFIVLMITLVYMPSVTAAGMKIGGYKMGHLGIGQGAIYSKSAYPISISNHINNATEDLSTLKSGKSVAHNYFKMVEVGDAGINRAIRRGKLNRVSIVATKIHKINIPLGYIPLYYKETKTVVYGNCEEDL